MYQFFTRLLDVIGVLAFGAFILSALSILYYLWVAAMYGWLGGWGIALALVGAPLAVVFPFTEWWMEGRFPEETFWIWAAGVLGVVVSMGRGFLPLSPDDGD